jgi:subtilase family serine protease
MDSRRRPVRALAEAARAGALAAIGLAASVAVGATGTGQAAGAAMLDRASPPATSPAAMSAAGMSPAATSLGRSALAGTHPAWAVPSRLVASPDAGSAISARLYLAGRDPAGLAAYAAAVSDPRSRSYRKFLTAGQERARYGPTGAQVTAVTRWLQAAGLRVTGTAEQYVAFTGPVRAADRAFAVRLASFREPGGVVAMAPEQDASVPGSLRPAVLTVLGLDTASVVMKPAQSPPPAFYRAPPCSQYYGQRVATSEPEAYGRHVPWGVCGYTPRQLRGAYGVDAGIDNGSGVTVAIVDAYVSPYMPRDADTWASRLGEPELGGSQYRQAPQRSYDDEAACDTAGWYQEQTLDVEAVHSMAPDADIEYVPASDCTFEPLLDALTWVVDNHAADIVSASWTGGEQGLTTSDTSVFDQVFEQGATEGIGFDFASGDCGYNDPGTGCGRQDMSTEYQANFPSSSVWVTAVGGTSLAIGKNANYEWEVGWGSMVVPLRNKRWTPAPPGRYPASYVYGSGGGTSRLYEQPSYQAGVVPRSLATRLPNGTTSKSAMREVPDVAMDADPSTGFLVGETVRLRTGKNGFMLSRIGGTSLAAPLFAGLEADAAQATDTHEIGFINPTLYLMAGTNAFHDITGSPLGRGARMALARNEWATTAKGTGKIITELFTLGADGLGKAALAAAGGYSDVTGLGSPAPRFITELATGRN